MENPIADISSQPLPESARRVIDALETAGFEAWVVGGFVRDALLGRSVHDVDIATNALWQDAKQACESAGLRTYETGTAHGTISVQAARDAIAEVTTYRTEGAYSDARHPDEVRFVTSIEEDLARRDFTMNAIAYHPARGLHDPYQGSADIAAGVIRAVGDPQKRFAEDALRILRALRFASELGFALDPATQKAANACAKQLDLIAPERISAELNRLLCGQNVRAVLMDHAAVIDTVLPELSPMRGFDQKTPYHIYDVFEHTAYVVECAPATTLLRWAALLHDVGKPDSFTVDDKGQGHFFGHAKRSAAIAEHVMARLKMPARFSTDVVQLVRYHDTHIQPDRVPVKKLLRKMGGRDGLMRELCDLQWADAQSHAPGFRTRGDMARNVEALMEQVLAENEVFSLRQLAIGGGDILSLGVEPGPAVGQLLEEALDEVVCDRLPNDRDALMAFVKDHMRLERQG